ncbi:MAG: hypothetical protein ACFE95_21350 [Candidatus Hodarchaeota archaeon]
MIVYAVYIITEDGRTILSENFQSTKGLPNEVLFGGVLTALQQMTAEMTSHRSEMKSVEIEGLSYHLRSFGLIRVVLVTDAPKTPEDILQVLGLRFIKKYGEVLIQSDFNLNIFDPFRKTIKEIVQQSVTDVSKSIQPAKKLTTGEVFSLPTELHSTALALISLESGTLNEIAQESGNSIKTTESNLAELQKKGFIGTKKEKGIVKYFCSI